MNIHTPDGNIMTSTHEANLDIPKLPDSATRAHIVPELSTHSLLSLGQFCDAGCTATIDQDTIDIFYQNEMVLSGQRSPDTTLWHIEYPIDDKPQIHYANNTIGRITTANIVAFMHAAFFHRFYQHFTKPYSLDTLPIFLD
jgi:hypothetical protein